MKAHSRPYEISKAAELVGIGSKTLFRELRARNILTDRNYPIPYYVQNGYFSVDTRAWKHPVTGRQMQYHITTVLPLGMCLISQIAQDIRHGKQTPAAPHCGTDSVTTNQAAEIGSTAISNTSRVAAIGGVAHQTDIRQTQEAA